MSDNIDLTVLDAEPDLGSYVASQQYEPVAGADPSVEGITQDTLDALTEGGVPDVAVAGVAQPEGSPGPTTPVPPSAEPDQNLLAMLRQEREQSENVRRLLNEQIVAGFRAQEAAFQASIADLPDEDRRAAVAERQRDLALARAQLAERRAQTLQQTQQANAESWAKSEAARILAERHGLAADDIPALMGAGEPQHMVVLAERLGQLRAQASATAPAPALHPNARAVGPAAPPAAPPAPKAQPRSGNLLDLIQSRTYTRQPASPSGT